MAFIFHILIFTMILVSSAKIHTSTSYSSPGHGLSQDSSLSVDIKDDVLVSSNGRFTAGFHQVGDNAYVFAVWFSKQVTTTRSRTVVWIANRDAPVNGRHSKLVLREDGNLVLVDAGYYVIWSTRTKSSGSSVRLQLENTGNLVLYGRGNDTIWQSFDYPTNTLLPNQPFTKFTKLVSSTSSTNYSSGFYKLFFDTDSILRLLYDGRETTTIYWPHPSFRNFEAGRLQYIYNRRAILDSNGQFNSSDWFKFKCADFGTGPQRIMRLDIDGNLRVYSLVEHENRTKWVVQWQAIAHSCVIHGTCGPNSLCTTAPDSGGQCSCLHGHKMVNSEDWSYGCEPEFQQGLQNDSEFIELRHVEFYGYDIQLLPNHTLNACKNYCLQDSNCKGFQYGWLKEKGFYYCFIKNSLHNGIQMGFDFPMYIKLPKRLVSSFYQKTASRTNFSCPRPRVTPIVRSYDKKHDDELLGLIMVFGCIIGFIEIICIVFFWYCTSRSSSKTERKYLPAATGFRQFTYTELKKASRNFSEEIGRGGACVVYKGKLADNRIAAIKMLNSTNYDQGEAEFKAEISAIGRVNHMNLIQMLGYCAEGKHKLVVYEYMENGSLAENLCRGKLDWAARVSIAKNTAKGLAYLHEECLEWVLHCDVKPPNILLDADYNPKVADFGLSKLIDRNGIDEPNYSMIRGTRGYMAPEWVINLPITSKVDVYSNGVVILEMITGRNPADIQQTSDEEGGPKHALIDWVRDRVQELDTGRTIPWVEEIIDPSISGEYDRKTVENLVRIALQCTKEDREARPSMAQVLNMFIHI